MQSHIIKPQDIGGDRFHIGKDLAGNFIFSVNNQSIKMTPSQTNDLAVRLLKALGHIVEVEDLPANLMAGPRLVG